MQPNLRHPEILDLARNQGRVTVEGLAERFGVTVQTIRRDLSDLADAGQLQRVHGGAVLPSGTTNIGYEDRRALKSVEKQAMAGACAALIPEGASVFLNIGTSTEAVARALLQHRRLLVVTNNMNVATILAANPEAEVIVTGGTLRRSDGGLVGPLASDTIRQFKFDFAVIGCSALDQDGDLLDFDVQEVTVSQVILNQARHSILVADHSKFHRNAPARIVSLQHIDTFVTDQALSLGVANKCLEWNTKVIVAG
jgi:DeoR family transcriptional regulator, glycerol-3-phosphate regulon repressor